jgi:hypothetical protein
MLKGQIIPIGHNNVYRHTYAPYIRVFPYERRNRQQYLLEDFNISLSKINRLDRKLIKHFIYLSIYLFIHPVVLRMEPRALYMISKLNH